LPSQQQVRYQVDVGDDHARPFARATRS
jgi:hypothetical protein